MITAAVFATLFGSTVLGAYTEAPITWSPDGRWVVYTLSASPIDQALEAGWFFNARRPARAASRSTPTDRLDNLVQSTHRIWATLAETGESTLLAESRGPLSSPAWNPDGSAIAFVRLSPNETASTRHEIIVRDASGSRVLASRIVEPDLEPVSTFSGAPVAWSPDGRHLAVPLAGPNGLLFVRADNGHALKTIPGASQPAWSPDGTKVAFFRAGTPDTLCVMDSNFGEPRALAEAPQSRRVPSPVWSRDGKILFFVSRARGNHVNLRNGQQQPMAPQLRALSRPAAQGGSEPEAACLERIRVETGDVENHKSLLHEAEPIVSPEMFLGASFTLDPDGNDCFYSTYNDAQKSQITWAQATATRKRFNPFDEMMPLGALAHSPRSRRLALRVGPPGPSSPVAFCEPESERLVPVVPDDSARVAWLITIVGKVRDILPEMPARIEMGAPALERPTLLPSPVELAENQPPAQRLARLGRLGRGLCTRPADEPSSADAAVARLEEEVGLLCTYLAGDYHAAETALERVEERTVSTRDQRRLAAVRAQIDLGLGRIEVAQMTIDCLRASKFGQAQRIEETPSGMVVTKSADPMDGWLALLESQSEARDAAPGNEADAPPEIPSLVDPRDALPNLETQDVKSTPPRSVPGQRNRKVDPQPSVPPAPPMPQMNIPPVEGIPRMRAAQLRL
jgi:Tol biopolymer transport system component